MLGRLSRKNGNLDQAVTHYEKAAVNPNIQHLANNNLGVIRYRQGKMGEAVAALGKAATGDARALFNLAVVKESESLEAARDAWKAYLKAMKDSKEESKFRTVAEKRLAIIESALSPDPVKTTDEKGE